MSFHEEKSEEKPEENRERIELAANEGDPNSQYKWGLIIKEGGDDDLEIAFEWIQKAAEKGIPHAQYDLAFMLLNGEGCEINPEEAFKWFKKAAVLGFAPAMFDLALLLKNGEGCERDLGKALEWFKEGAEQGLPDAQYNLACMLENGEGCERNLEKAFEWYQRAAMLGIPAAQNNLAYMFQHGEGCEINLEKAFFWYKRAAKQGNPGAEYNLAVMYQNGEGCEKNSKEAIKLFHKIVMDGYQLRVDEKKWLLEQFHSQWFPSSEDIYLIGSTLITRPDPALKAAEGFDRLQIKFQELVLKRPNVFAGLLSKEKNSDAILASLPPEVVDFFIHSTSKEERIISAVTGVPEDVSHLISQYSGIFIASPPSPSKIFEVILNTFEKQLNGKDYPKATKDREMKLDIDDRNKCLLQIAEFRKLLTKDAGEVNFTKASRDFLTYIESEKTRALSLLPKRTKSKFIEICNTYPAFLPPHAKKFVEKINNKGISSAPKLIVGEIKRKR